MKNNKSFTLVETLAVITIIGILSGFLILRFQESNYEAEFSRAKAFSLSVLMSLPVETVSEWKFDGPTTAGSSATLDDVKDTWGANDGVVVNGGTLIRDGVDCVSGKCLEFDGIDDFIRIDHGQSLVLSGNYTISFWAYNGNGTATWPTLFNKRQQSTTNGYFWCYSSGTNEVNITHQWSSGSSTNSTVFYNVFDLNKWNYLVFTFNNSNKILKLYKNGSYTNDPKTLTNAVSVIDGNLFLGTYNGSTSSSYPFKGKIDEFRIFNDVLTVSQINQMYLAGLDSLYLSNQIPKEEYNQRLSELKMNLTKHE